MAKKRIRVIILTTLLAGLLFVAPSLSFAPEVTHWHAHCRDVSKLPYMEQLRQNSPASHKQGNMVLQYGACTEV